MCWKPCMKGSLPVGQMLVHLRHCNDNVFFDLCTLQREDEDPCFRSRWEETLHRLEQVYMGLDTAWKFFLWQWINIFVNHIGKKTPVNGRRRESIWELVPSFPEQRHWDLSHVVDSDMSRSQLSSSAMFWPHDSSVWVREQAGFRGSIDVSFRNMPHQIK